MHPAVEEYIESLPEHFHQPMEEVRHMILDLHPGVEERWKHQCPFYYFRKRFCYLNCPKDTIILGFVHGNEMQDHAGLLQGNGAQVRHFMFDPKEPLPYDLLHHYLIESITVDKKRTA
jgi:hypothetical protein